MLGIGGMEKNVVNLVRRMDGASFEHTICVIRSLGTMANDVPPDRGSVVCLGKANAGRSFLVSDLARQIRQTRPHIVHSRNWGAIEAVFAGKWAGSCALVHSEHGLDDRGSRPEPWRRKLLRRTAYRISDRVFSVSYHLRELLAQRTGIAPSRIGVIHNGVDTVTYAANPELRARGRQRLGLTPDDFCFGALGRLEPVKDLPTLLQAAAALPPALGKWRLVIAGDGSEAEPLRRMAAETPALAERVTFLGAIDCIPEFLNATDTYVLPSLYEGISNSLLEAMAVGLPVIASAVGGNNEVVTDGESGLTFQAGDVRRLSAHLQTLCRERKKRQTLGRQALATVEERFSMDAMIRNYDRLYRGLAPLART